MKTALWIYFGAITILCASLLIAIPWFGRIIHHANPGSLLPWPTQILIDCRYVLYAVPLPSLFLAVRSSVGGELDAQRAHVVGAYSFFMFVLLVCITLLAVMIPLLPWGITLQP